MKIEQIMARAEKELSTATRNLETAQRRGAPGQDVRNLEAKVEYRKAVLEILKDKPLELFEKVEQLEQKNDDLLERAEAAEKRAEKAERERDEAVETIFKWTGCPECKYWDSATDWCEKHDRYATISDGCTTPEWRGMKEE